MWIKFFLYSFFLLQGAIQQPSEPFYLITMPAEIHYPSKEMVCIGVLHARELIEVTVTLQSESRDDTLIEQNIVGPEYFNCVPFEVPPPYDGLKEVATLQVSIVDSKSSIRIFDRKEVLIKRVMDSALIETDKPLYNPGDTVKVRLVTFNPRFLPSIDKIPLVDIQDPKNNRIAQWLDKVPLQGIVDLSFDLSSDTVLGIYTINVEHLRASKSFLVQNYESQRFEVLILLVPSVVTLEDSSLEVKVCGRYTYGKPSKGHIEGTVCRPAKHYSWYGEGRLQDICVEFSGQTDGSGCFFSTANIAIFQPMEYGYKMNFNVMASLVEEGTDVKVQATSSFPLSSTIAMVTFDDTDSYYKSGMPLKVKMKLLGADSMPMKTKRLFLIVEVMRTKTEFTSITDESGTAHFILDTFSWNRNTVYLKGIFKKEKPMPEPGKMVPHYKDAIMVVAPFYSLTNTFLKIQPPDDMISCGSNYELEVDYIVRGSDLAGGEEKLQFNYIVVARGAIVQFGQKEMNVSKTSVLKGSLSITIPVSADIAPIGRMLIYSILPSGIVSADSAQFRVSKCFKNKVNLWFSESECFPSSNVSLQLEASPGSLCAVRVLGKSVLLGRPAAELTSDSIYRLLPVLNQVGYSDLVMEMDPPCLPPMPWYQKRSLPDQLPEVSGHPVRKRSIGMPSSNQNKRDAFSNFMKMGLKIITNTEVKKPPRCNYYYPPMASQIRGDELGDVEEDELMPNLDDMPVVHTGDVNPRIESLLQDTRSNFEDTWVWDLVSIGSSGNVNMSLKTPDTITEWKASALCMAKTGIGLSQPVMLRTFKSVFVDLVVPYSLVRGEGTILKATVFNHLAHIIQVRTTLEKRSRVKLEPCENCTYITCLRAEESRTFSWIETAEVLGIMKFRVTTEALDTEELCYGERPVVPEDGGRDAVVKDVLVQAEGVLVELSYSNLLCAEGNLSTETIPITLSKQAIKGSESAEFFIIGDLMGKAMHNMENLLAMPYGYGEQTMSKMDPIFILQYLQSSGQLTEPIKRKALQFMEQGYQRMRNYRRLDGSFSAFGDRDPEGNLWLTVCIAKNLYAAKDHIPVDNHYIREAVTWIKNNQLPSGGFHMVGRLFKNSIKGGNNDDHFLSAIVIIALLEMNFSHEDLLLENALQYLRNAAPATDSPNIQAPMAYAFTLSGEKDEEMRELVLRKLYKQAVKEGGQLYWNLRPKRKSSSQFWSQPESSEVEVAAYVLLAHLSKKDVSKEEIVKASQIAAWLSRQCNAQGGFATAQDTTVALQAMAHYATFTYSGTEGITVKVTSSSGFKHYFTVNNSNRLLLQEVTLPDVPGEYRAEVQGDGCAYLQITLKYHIPPPKNNATFALSVEVEQWNCSIPICNLNISIHVRYLGTEPASNMVLLVTGILSGYSANMNSVKMTEKNPLVKKSEVIGSEVILYVDQLTQEKQTFTFSIKQDIPVRNQQPEYVKVYDYYKPDDYAIVEYNSPSPDN